MIRALPYKDRARARRAARRQWHRSFVPLAILTVEGTGRALVVMRSMDTRWSENQRRRLWRVPAQRLRGPYTRPFEHDALCDCPACSEPSEALRALWIAALAIAAAAAILIRHLI